jgi:hypothetical protein
LTLLAGNSTVFRLAFGPAAPQRRQQAAADRRDVPLTARPCWIETANVTTLG